MQQLSSLKKLIAIAFTAIAITATSCSQNPIDKALDQYESVVVKWENKSKSQKVSMGDMQEIQKDFLDLGINPDVMLAGQQVSKAQQKRAMDLAKRMSKLVMPF
jgi:hypothetical protein